MTSVDWDFREDYANPRTSEKTQTRQPRLGNFLYLLLNEQVADKILKTIDDRRATKAAERMGMSNILPEEMIQSGVQAENDAQAAEAEEVRRVKLPPKHRLSSNDVITHRAGGKRGRPDASSRPVYGSEQQSDTRQPDQIAIDAIARQRASALNEPTMELKAQNYSPRHAAPESNPTTTLPKPS